MSFKIFCPTYNFCLWYWFGEKNCTFRKKKLIKKISFWKIRIRNLWNPDRKPVTLHSDQSRLSPRRGWGFSVILKNNQSLKFSVSLKIASYSLEVKLPGYFWDCQALHHIANQKEILPLTHRFWRRLGSNPGLYTWKAGATLLSYTLGPFFSIDFFGHEVIFGSAFIHYSW